MKRAHRITSAPPVRHWLEVKRCGDKVQEVAACKVCRIRRAVRRGPYRHQWCLDCGAAVEHALSSERQLDLAYAVERPEPRPPPVQLMLAGIAGAVELHRCVRCRTLRAVLYWRHVRARYRVALYVTRHPHEGDRWCEPFCRDCGPREVPDVRSHVTLAALDAVLLAMAPIIHTRRAQALALRWHAFLPVEVDGAGETVTDGSVSGGGGHG